MAIRKRNAAGTVVISGGNVRPRGGVVRIADKPPVVDAVGILVDRYPAVRRTGPDNVALLPINAIGRRPALGSVPVLDGVHPATHGHTPHGRNATEIFPVGGTFINLQLVNIRKEQS